MMIVDGNLRSPAQRPAQVLPKPPEDPDVLIEAVGKVAMLLQRAVNRGDNAAVRGELLRLGSLAWPVMLKLGETLSPAKREALQLEMCSAMTTVQPPHGRSMVSFNNLLTLSERLRKRKR